MAIGAQSQVQVPVGLLKEAPYMGHKGGNHIFRMVQDADMDDFSKCFKYEGQVPEDSREQLRKFRIVLLPDILDMVICLLAFTPCPTRGQNRQMVPQELQVIRDKQGCVNQDDIGLLLNIWQLKFRDDLIYTLRHSNMLALAVSWDSLMQLIELASDSSFKKLLQSHHQNMEEEGLRMLYGEEGSRRRVLVYCSQEDVAYAAAPADERRDWKKDAAHGDAFSWAAQPISPGYAKVL
ncbi:hypothetical protein B0T24DRAFT_680947 [Lasiosphaeria ovina]|uniref:Uncharacterized protein n=1 Tax=Lasiosphaeria ovina TaxID=92902 RepID=A0AAE0K3K1_9PEZI|nr:hypothetical protein B0T24DRAFT_680947 [Lasiosphaeria ovina]